MNDVKKWHVKYSHKDGRSGEIQATTEISEKSGLLTVGDFSQGYDLRYERGDLHKIMLNDYFGAGLVTATEM